MENDDRPVGQILSRREALKLLGIGSAALLAAYTSPQEVRSLIPTPGPSSSSPLNCVVRPELSIGPYFVDDQLNRSDIRYDPREDNVSEGIPLALNINVSRVTS